MATKVCFKCNENKDIGEYYNHIGMSDGKLNKCKSCTKKDSLKRYVKIISTEEGHEKERERNRCKYYRLGYKEKYKPTSENKKKNSINYQLKYPEKKISSALCCKLKPKIKGNNLHHWSYRKEHAKDVIELSKKDHYKAHRFLIYDKDLFMYKTKSGKILNTKKKHIDFLLDIGISPF